MKSPRPTALMDQSILSKPTDSLVSDLRQMIQTNRVNESALIMELVIYISKRDWNTVASARKGGIKVEDK